MLISTNSLAEYRYDYSKRYPGTRGVWLNGRCVAGDSVECMTNNRSVHIEENKEKRKKDCLDCKMICERYTGTWSSMKTSCLNKCYSCEE